MRNRSTIEIMVLTLTMLVSGSVIAMGLLMVVVVILNPTADVSGLADAISAILTLILGTLLGLLAGKAPDLTELSKRPDEYNRLP